MDDDCMDDDPRRWGNRSSHPRLFVGDFLCWARELCFLNRDGVTRDEDDMLLPPEGARDITIMDCEGDIYLDVDMMMMTYREIFFWSVRLKNGKSGNKVEWNTQTPGADG